MKSAYGRFLGFLLVDRPDLLERPPEARINPVIMADYLAWRRRKSGSKAIFANDLRRVRSVLSLITQNVDLS
jgi:hypothetical protein